MFFSLCWVCVGSVTDALRVNNPGSLVVVLVLTSVSLHVKISVKVVRVYLGMVTPWNGHLFLEHVCAGGGGGGNMVI